MKSQINSLGWRDYALSVAAFAVTLAAFLPFARIGVDAHHDGIMLKPALDVLSGQAIFRDTFTQYGALSTYIQAWVLGVFGQTLLVLKQSTVFAYAFASAFMVLSWRSFLPLGLTVLSYVFWLNFPPFYDSSWTLLPWSSVYALTFQCVAMFLLVRSIGGAKNTALDFFGGVAAACTFWCRGPVGAFLFVAMIGVYLAQSQLRGQNKLRPFLLGFAAVHAIFAIILTRTGAWSGWWFQNFVWPSQWNEGKFSLRFAQQRLTPYPNQGMILLAMLAFFLVPFSRLTKKWPFLSLTRGRFKYVYGAAMIAFLIWGFQGDQFVLTLLGGWASPIPFVVCCYFLGITIPFLRGRRAWSSIHPAAWAACAVALSSWMQYIPVTDPRHIFWSIAPIMGCTIYVGYIVTQQRQAALIAVAVLFLLPMLRDRAFVIDRSLSAPYVELKHPPLLKGMLVTQEWDQQVAPIIENLETYFRTESSRPVLLEGHDGLFAAIGPDFRNPGPIFVYWWQMKSPELVPPREQFVRKYRPVVVTEANPRGYLDPLLTEYHYALYFQTKSGIKIWIPPRSPSPPSG